MLAVSSNKRHRDSPASQPEACSPHRAAMLLESPASKRTRAHGEPSSASLGSGSSSAFMQQLDGMQPGAAQQPTPEQVLQQQQLGQRVDPITGEHLFSMEQVRDIVRRAVEEKERTLREQYDRILQQKLQEQYQVFAKFNEDYVSRTVKSGDLGYVS